MEVIMATQKKPTFEQSLGRLEEIVELLEDGEAPLDTLLALFEEGSKLIKACNKMLDTAEQTVVRLSQDADGTVRETLFPVEEG
jgi:exodeoxyribonuclease VII small subunit